MEGVDLFEGRSTLWEKKIGLLYIKMKRRARSEREASVLGGRLERGQGFPDNTTVFTASEFGTEGRTAI